MTICSVEVCDRPAHVRGWCIAHYNRWARTGEAGTSPIGVRNSAHGPTCSIEGCGRVHDSHGLCSPHGRRLRKFGDPLAGPPLRPYRPRMVYHDQCLVDGCKKPSRTLGMCGMHYARERHGYSERHDYGPNCADCGKSKADTQTSRRFTEFCATCAKRRWHEKLGHCSFPGCTNWRYGTSTDLCATHRKQQKKGRELSPIRARRTEPYVGASGYMYEPGGKAQHRAVMEEMLGRPLVDDETVHHKNGVRTDNRPSNLELWASSHPPGQRVSDLVEFARSTLKRWEPDGF